MNADRGLFFEFGAESIYLSLWAQDFDRAPIIPAGLGHYRLLPSRSLTPSLPLTWRQISGKPPIALATAAKPWRGTVTARCLEQPLRQALNDGLAFAVNVRDRVFRSRWSLFRFLHFCRLV